MRSHPTKLLSAKAALFVLLAFQLIVGLPLQAAQAALEMPAGATQLDMPAATRAHATTATSGAPAAMRVHAVAATSGAAAATQAPAITATPRTTTAIPSTTTVAPSAVAATPSPSNTTPTALAANDDCPMHDAAHGAAPIDGGNKHAPSGNHDCCHVSACQCQCVYTPAAFDLPPLADFMSRLALPSLSSAQFVAPRIDEFLRPPIA